MKPEVYATVLAMSFNVVFGVVLVLGWPVPGWHGIGFQACPAVTAGAEFIQLCFFFGVYFWWQVLGIIWNELYAIM